MMFTCSRCLLMILWQLVPLRQPLAASMMCMTLDIVSGSDGCGEEGDALVIVLAGSGGPGLIYVRLGLGLNGIQ